MNCGQRKVIEEHSWNNPAIGCQRKSLRVAKHVVAHANKVAQNHVTEGEVNDLLVCKDVADNGRGNDERPNFSFRHAEEKKRVVLDVNLRVENGFDVSCSAPTDLLLQPPTQGCWRIRSCQDIGAENHSPPSSKKVGCEMAVFVDDLRRSG